MEHLLQFWNYRISFLLTVATGVLLLWQIAGAKGTGGHLLRWASAFGLSIFVVYMNTQWVLSRPRVTITNQLHINVMAFHQTVGLVYFALMAVMPILGAALFGVVSLRWPGSRMLRTAHKWTGYAAGTCWLISNIASEIGSRIPLT